MAHIRQTTGPSAFFDQMFARTSVMAILRGMDTDRTVRLCERAWDVGIDVVEVPVQTPDALPSLRAAVAAGRERGRPVGAGTVASVDQVRDVSEAGAAFTVAPGLDEDVAQASVAAGLPHLPGVATSSEITRALKSGNPWLKAFPAACLTPAWITAQLAPFPGARFVATGGVDAQNAGAFLDAGCKVVAVGSALADPDQLDLLADLVRTR
ncbi:2-dehydro-3-deoxyphosphogluconate aldolase/(4S)-4-hydroxy-2-oxoglutarate aldolase [Spinactinospora alkalitolerans]|uniref:2-dehydro-3-deoxyphosphogluconate aldolase/(4S)-4-hydroxy-2-oxoglutarate aldolase n=1 Tax=Spinactinospora alkalitolerans TaxID=687207 RepID=A0A852TVG4_9ACTN|nr:bifunctional 4-hydroxy-2-oxoglutarate aldolase/2-dehydro-3-deoxy-phosphogluconate aldolase [Spinactinospora alkalitolerans]NYE48476.1 2-dehydro-3-deoxyphosphogluconate aldolase/(4S)-4-hydroxy-2-oxoglutarate aldolase [Spinactinospora alkalitolerans]